MTPSEAEEIAFLASLFSVELYGLILSCVLYGMTHLNFGQNFHITFCRDVLPDLLTWCAGFTVCNAHFAQLIAPQPLFKSKKKMGWAHMIFGIFLLAAFIITTCVSIGNIASVPLLVRAELMVSRNAPLLVSIQVFDLLAEWSEGLLVSVTLLVHNKITRST